MTERHPFPAFRIGARALRRILPAICCWLAAITPARSAAGATADSERHFNVQAYVVEGNPILPSSAFKPVLSKHIGPDISAAEIVQAATDVQAAYRKHGYPDVSVAVAPDEISNGVVILSVFQAPLPQIVVSGQRYLSFSNGMATMAIPSGKATAHGIAAARTNAIAAFQPRTMPDTPREMELATRALRRKMVELAAMEKDRRIHVVSTNAGPRFDVQHYVVSGNTVLTPAEIAGALTNVDAFGTNVSFEGVSTIVSQLGKAYHDRGYVTVNVDVPQQKLTNATVKLDVLEGRLADIKVIGNRYFSSNNVMRALPDLRPGIVLNGPVFNEELNLANANRDRQIYPLLGPGPLPGTGELSLTVKDQLPLHGKLELNNQASPGTPAMRLNASAEYDNLWQLENSLGVQYSFSPELYKPEGQWDLYDEPAVANYSAFYRLPLGTPESIGTIVEGKPRSFGYSEATGRFRLPPPTGQPELTVYGSRAAIDTGPQTLLSQALVTFSNGGNVSQQTLQHDTSINDDLGFQLSKPLPPIDGLNSTISGGLDFKVYSLANFQTNAFIFLEIETNGTGTAVPVTSSVYDPTPATLPTIDYLPLNLNYNGSVNNFMGPATFGLAISADLWFNSHTSIGTNAPLSGAASIQQITGSTKSSGYWVALRPSYTQNLDFYPNWTTTFRADGQWATEPLISPEQFGAGGVASVRGYNEGEVFGDTGWHVSLDQFTPPYIVGAIRAGMPLTVQGDIYVDYARVYLLDPMGRQASTGLWGTGFGFTASAGPHWQGQFLFSWPLEGTPFTAAFAPYFNFSISAQF
ncbi:MAG: hypothetical protein KGR98_06415 [Verrucomicrobia bacterium]|nr:hypothetical protein [Verrucomicrobiota bacterium]MDE3099130.1 hypothetical protein [Verrucomicrobiota bacterium]